MIGAPNTRGQKYWEGIGQWAPETSISEEIADIFRNYDIDNDDNGFIQANLRVQTAHRESFCLFKRLFGIGNIWSERLCRQNRCFFMMTSSNRNLFRVTGPLCGEFTGYRWIPFTKASDTELWCFPWSAPEQTVGKQLWRLWFVTSSRSSWRQCNVMPLIISIRGVADCLDQDRKRYRPV